MRGGPAGSCGKNCFRRTSSRDRCASMMDRATSVVDTGAAFSLILMKKQSLFAPIILSLLLVACTQATLPSNPDDAVKIQEYNNPLVRKSGEAPTHPAHGKEAALWYGAVEGAGCTNANGVAFMQRFEDGSYVITVNRNILQAPEGKHYEALLQNADGSDVLTLGELRSIVGDTRHSVKLDTTYDAGKLLNIQVLLMTDGADRGELVAMGTMKATK